MLKKIEIWVIRYLMLVELILDILMARFNGSLLILLSLEINFSKSHLIFSQKSSKVLSKLPK